MSANSTALEPSATPRAPAFCLLVVRLPDHTGGAWRKEERWSELIFLRSLAGECPAYAPQPSLHTHACPSTFNHSHVLFLLPALALASTVSCLDCSTAHLLPVLHPSHQSWGTPSKCTTGPRIVCGIPKYP